MGRYYYFFEKITFSFGFGFLFCLFDFKILDGCVRVILFMKCLNALDFFFITSARISPRDPTIMWHFDQNKLINNTWQTSSFVQLKKCWLSSSQFLFIVIIMIIVNKFIYFGECKNESTKIHLNNFKCVEIWEPQSLDGVWIFAFLGMLSRNFWY